MAETLQVRVAPGKSLPLSNPDKLLFPGFNKLQILEYYVAAAPFILPHLKNRPVSLKRFPNGIYGESFWEKDAPAFAPEWVKTFPVPRKHEAGDISYIIINDARTLAWCAAIAAIELHPFLHTVPQIERPTQVVFDLDPGEGADILNCVEVAFDLKALLQTLKLKSFAKVSGSKGIQVYIPLNTSITYDVTRPFAKATAEFLEREHPDRIISEMTRAHRAGKVFIDWSQNMETKTTVGVYSMRAKHPKPYISMPVTWEELRKALDKSDRDSLYFTPDASLKRLASLGDLYAPVLKLKQRLPASVLASLGTTEPRSKRRHISEPSSHSSSQSPKALRAYEVKRNFTRTTEPLPGAPRRSQQGGKRRFVIQKHAASHLHYDLRLEMRDVLKSWSVPKGMPLQPDQVRTGIAVEDHPLEYLRFEGIIPEGQYGGGTVMVWDIGTYELVEGNYYRGEMEIFLNGSKLKGQWRLQRQRAENDRQLWAITKIGRPAKVPSAKRLEVSALSGRSLEQIKADKDREWLSASKETPRSRMKARGPAFVAPMLAKRVAKLPSGPRWQYEVKWDGYRIQAIKHEKIVRLFSRRGSDMARRFPQVVRAVAKLPVTTAVIDGEIVAVDRKGQPSFQALQNRASMAADWSIVYYAFDLLSLEGEDLIRTPLAERRDRLQHLIAGSEVRFSSMLTGNAQAVMRVVKEHELEGVVAKRTDSVYEPGGRSGAWVKLPLKPKQEFVIGGYRPGRGNFELLLVGYYDKGKFMFAGKVRQGLNRWNRSALFKLLKPLIRTDCPFKNLPNSKSDHFGESVTAEEMNDYTWVEPELVAEIKFSEWTRGQVLRHAEFLGLRDDKSPKEIVRES